MNRYISAVRPKQQRLAIRPDPPAPRGQAREHSGIPETRQGNEMCFGAAFVPCPTCHKLLASRREIDQ